MNSKDWKHQPWVSMNWLETSLKVKKFPMIHWKTTTNKKKSSISIENDSSGTIQSNFLAWQTTGALSVQYIWDHPTIKELSIVLPKQVKITDELWMAYWRGWWLAVDAIPRQIEPFKRPNINCSVFIETLPLSYDLWMTEYEWAKATIWVRTIQESPSNMRNPTILVRWMKEACKNVPNLHMKVYKNNSKFLSKWGGFQAIQSGSHSHGYVIELRNHKKKISNPDVIFIGKGVNFDTGGISLKSIKSMSLMRMDLTGALCAFALLRTFCFLQDSRSMVAILPIVDNLIDSKSILPGSVVSLYGGPTIEITDPDAEGRILLAEASLYGQSQYPRAKEVILLATITGIIDNVGNGLYSGLFLRTNQNLNKHNQFWYKWRKAGEQSQEQMIELPIDDTFESLIHSKIADYVNYNEEVKSDLLWSGFFLSHFWTSKAIWNYIDLSGSIDSDIQQPWAPSIARGLGVQMVRHYLST